MPQIPHQSDYFVPIVLGATGHRDLRPEDVDPLKQAVRGLFESLQKNYPNSELILFSALAEGADRLVADVALSMPRKIELVVPLPLPIEDYMRDFETATSKEEFLTLLKRASKYFEAPVYDQDNPNRRKYSKEARQKRYAAMGAYIARHSQILVALWDGVTSLADGGTSQIVEFKRNGISDPSLRHKKPLDLVDSGPVYHILTPRVSNQNVHGEPFSINRLYPKYWGDSSQADAQYSGLLKMVDTFNHDLKRLWSRVSGELQERVATLLPLGQSQSLDPAIRIPRERFAVADALAEEFKKKRVKVITRILSLVVIGFFFFQVYLELWHAPLVLLLYPVTLGAAIILFRWAKWRAIEYKHEDYRAFAEALRVHFFWKFLGIGEHVSDHYLQKHKGELEWIRYSMRVWEVVPATPELEHSSADPSSLLQRCREAAQGWIENQRKWFEIRSSENHQLLQKYEYIANRLFFFGVSAAFALFLMEYFSLDRILTHEWQMVIHYSLMFTIGMGLAISGAMHGLAEKLVLAEQSKQYRRMAGLYSLASDVVAESIRQNHLQGALKVFEDLGKEALMENGDWLLLHRARPIDLPTVS